MESGATSPAGAETSVSRSSFYAAMRVLPAEQRRAMFAIYAFCRAVDDVADGRDDRQARLADLARWRMDVEALFREVWHTITEVLGMLLELRLPSGVYLEWQGWNDPGPRWPKRFRWQLGTPPANT